MAAFIGDAVTAGEPILVVVDAAKIAALRTVLDGDAERVQFADIATVGRNPARIIPAWQAFVDQHSAKGQRLRGISEPIWAGRSPDELIECQHHESLLNEAFVDTTGFWLLCPYDTAALERVVIDQAHGTTHSSTAPVRAIPVVTITAPTPQRSSRSRFPNDRGRRGVRVWGRRSGLRASLRRPACRRGGTGGSRHGRCARSR